MRSVLLVEDDVWLSELYGKALERRDKTDVLYANSASSALKILDKGPVDLLILDIFLDRHNGIELLHELSSYNDTRLTPVIILSAVSEHDFEMPINRWEQYGVVKYLYKPTTKPQDLIEEVELQLQNTEVSDAN